MSIKYLNIARAVALRSNQLGDAVDAAALEALYTGDLLAALDGMEIPYSALKQQILASEKRIAALAARLKNPALKRGLYGRSANIADKGLMPQTDQNGYQWIGSFDSIIDAATGDELTEKPKQEVRRIKRLKTASIVVTNPLHYAIAGNKLFHTVTNAYVEGCVWDYATQSTAYDLAPSGPTSFTFTTSDVNTTNNTITKTAHGCVTGQRVIFPDSTSPGTSPANQLYSSTLPYRFAIYVDANTLKFATTLANALIGSAIDITSTGSGTMHVTVAPDGGGGYSPLAQELEVMFAADVLANLSTEDFFVAEAGRYADIVEKCEEDLKQGLIPQATLPDTTANQEPVKN